jgi:hypothetical protein
VKRTALQHNAPANDAISYAGYRFPPDVISYAVWLYYRFPLSLRMVEELLAARGIELTYETVRRWTVKFGLGIARRIRSTALARGDKWHLDEVVVTTPIPATCAADLSSGVPSDAHRLRRRDYTSLKSSPFTQSSACQNSTNIIESSQPSALSFAIAA